MKKLVTMLAVMVALSGCGQNLDEARDGEHRVSSDVAEAVGFEWPLTVTTVSWAAPARTR
jgi:hypothetical protein